MMREKNFKNYAHVTVDYQNDFVDPSGSMYVKGAEKYGEELDIFITNLNKKGCKTIFTADKHPLDMDSFASVHNLTSFTARESIIDTLKTDYYRPNHCIDKERGSEIYKTISLDNLQKAMHFVEKGTSTERELYSACKGTDLISVLKKNEIKNVLVTGVATDRCIQETVLDLLKEFEVYVIEDFISGITPESSQESIELMKSKGGKIISHQEIFEEK